MKMFDRRVVVLNLAKEILSKPKAFATGAWARYKDGSSLIRESGFDAANDPQACAWCYEGAVMKACGDLGYDYSVAIGAIDACDTAYTEAYKKAMKRRPQFFRIRSLNDNNGRKAVLGAMGRAINYLQKQFKAEQKAAAC